MSDDQIAKLSKEFNDGFESVNKKLTENDDSFKKMFIYMEKRFDEVDKRFKYIEDKFDKRFDLLTNIIDGYAAKIDMYAQEMAAMDHKIMRLEKYIQVLADHAGIDLEKIHI